MQDLAHWLEELGMSEYAQRFAARRRLAHERAEGDVSTCHGDGELRNGCKRTVRRHDCAHYGRRFRYRLRRRQPRHRRGWTGPLWDVDQAKLDAAQAKFGPKVRAKRVDITNPEEVERAAKDAEAAMGHIDILVCSAGVAGLNAEVVDYPIDEWKRVFDVNINGLFYCNRYVGRLMKARGYGRIVNISSVAGKEGNPTASAYSASKAAVIGFTKSLGKELATDGVTVNAVAPAVIETPMLGKVDAAHIAYMRSKIPMERFGTVEEVAALICWLASRECSFSTGAVFDLSGGRATY
jgi:2-dehydro-3-deoxy-L-rhamnonate dehydrogenase (NAD+)